MLMRGAAALLTIINNKHQTPMETESKQIIIDAFLEGAIWMVSLSIAIVCVLGSFIF